MENAKEVENNAALDALSDDGSDDLEALMLHGVVATKKKKRRFDDVRLLEDCGWHDAPSLEEAYTKRQKERPGDAAVSLPPTTESVPTTKAVPPTKERRRAPTKQPKVAPKVSQFNQKERRSRSLRNENDYVQQEKRILRQATDGYGY